MKKVDDLLSQAEQLVLDEIEKRVTKILLNPKNRAVSFVMSMGGACFYDQEIGLDETKYQQPVYDLLEKYDSVFKLTGSGWRWNVIAGEVVRSTNW